MSLLAAPLILLVDDEPEILAALRSGLQRGIPDARVLTASTGIQGLATIAAEPVDIIISDQKMPGMEGVEFLIRTRELAPTAVRMMLTAHPNANLLERNINEASIRHFFTKPYALADIVRVVRGVIEERRARAADAVAFARAIEAARRPRDAVGPRAYAPPMRFEL